MTLAQRIEHHLPQPGISDTAIPGLRLIHRQAPTPRIPLVYDPCLCVVAMGEKQAFLGAERFVYNSAHFLVLSVPLPLECQITQASEQAPYLALALDFDLEQLSSLIVRMEGAPAVTSCARAGIYATPVFPALTSSLERLLDCLGDPIACRALAPALVTELLFHLLRSPQGEPLRAAAQHNPYNRQIARVVSHMRAHFAEALDVPGLARRAHMSESSFFEHFKSVTRCSPLQYLKRIRLHEARRIMLAEHAAAGEAAFRVGYGSPSQFSREFKRLFGDTPARTVRRLRAEG